MALTVVTTLFEKLGAKPAIEAVVKEFYKRVLDDPELKGFFDGIDMDKQTRQQVAFLSMALGGPDEYQGRSMKDAHKHMGITRIHFDRVAHHLVETLKWAGVSEEIINEVVSIVAPLKADIVAA